VFFFPGVTFKRAFYCRAQRSFLDYSCVQLVSLGVREADSACFPRFAVTARGCLQHCSFSTPIPRFPHPPFFPSTRNPPFITIFSLLYSTFPVNLFIASQAVNRHPLFFPAIFETMPPCLPLTGFFRSLSCYSEIGLPLTWTGVAPCVLRTFFT